MNNFIMCFTEETKNKLVNQGYKLLNEIITDNKSIYYFKNNINKTIYL